MTGEEARPGGPRPWPVVLLRLWAGGTLFALLGFAVLAWFLTIHGDSMAGGMSPLSGRGGDMGMGVTDAASPMGLPLFVGMWVTMMVAMMFPSVAPMVVIYSRFSRLRNRTGWATPIFVAGYLLAWTLVGLVFFGVYRGAAMLTTSLPAQQARLVGGAALVLAGTYQLTRFKTVCLRHCRTPLDFMLHWRPGLGGGMRMGVQHGLFCVGCCWGLMLVLLAVGVTNLAWMALVAAVIFIEKVAPLGWATAKAVGVALIGLGAAVAFVPATMWLFAG